MLSASDWRDYRSLLFDNAVILLAAKTRDSHVLRAWIATVMYDTTCLLKELAREYCLNYINVAKAITTTTFHMIVTFSSYVCMLHMNFESDLIVVAIYGHHVCGVTTLQLGA